MTTTESTTVLSILQPTKLAQLTGFTDAQINLIRQTAALGANIVEVAWYLYNAKRLGLEPTLKQIYLIKYGEKPAEIVVGIDGYRKQAAASSEYAGSDDPVFEYEDVGQPKNAPSKATVTVWRMVQGMRVPFTASARWTEFYPGDGKIGEQYRKRPHNQLAIRAESHALRKGFPHQTERLEHHQGLPNEWESAAASYTIEEAARHSPERRAMNAAIYDRTIGASDWGEKVPVNGGVKPKTERQESPPPAEEDPGDMGEGGWGEGQERAELSRPAADELLKRNAELQTLARDAGAKGLGALKAAADWPADKIEQANTELSARIKSRDADLDAQAAAESTGDKLL